MGGDVHFIGGPIKVQGDVMLVQELHAIARQLDIDWETGLAGLLGDTLSYPLSRGLKQFFGIANRFASNMMRNTGDYLREEKELVPVRWEVDEFITDNRDLRADVDRVESRVNRLKARLDKLAMSAKGDAS
jgi:ubiquinone biosynthesis accessory factor UbiJ